ncbi:MAG: IS21 family transposase [Synergistaceae bacterium]|nr:IS21 family transposase [Synergistaceae bacterium]
MDAISIKLLAEEENQSTCEVEMVTEDDASKIRALQKLGYGYKKIARELSLSRNTVRKYGRDGAKAMYHQRNPRKGILSGKEEWLKEKFFQHNGNADVVRQELKKEYGLSVSLRTVERAVKAYHEELLRKDLATVRFETPPGYQMQIDFGERVVPIGGEGVRAHFFVAKLGFSRRLYVRAFEHENQQNWMRGIEEAIRYFGGMPQQLLIDNAGALVLEHNRGTHEVKFTESFKAFAEYWGFELRACMPGRPQTKGKVESGVKYVKRNCIAGHEFSSWGEMEAHISRWMREEADERQLGDKGDTPLRRFEAEESRALRPLEWGKPSFCPIREITRKAPHDCFVRVDTNSYSVPCEHIGKEVCVQVTEEEVILSLYKGPEIARHRLCHDRHKRIEKPEHFNGIIFRRDEDKGHKEKEGAEDVTVPREVRVGELERSLEEYEEAVKV